MFAWWEWSSQGLQPSNEIGERKKLASERKLRFNISGLGYDDRDNKQIN